MDWYAGSTSPFLLERPAVVISACGCQLESSARAGLFRLIDRGDGLGVSVVPVSEKADLNKTPIMQYLDACL